MRAMTKEEDELLKACIKLWGGRQQLRELTKGGEEE